METTIKWNAGLFGVEIKTEDEHFVISAQPSMVMTWNDAVRYFEGNEVWELPTKKQMKIVAKKIDKVNEMIKAYGGCEIIGCIWTAGESDEFCALLVNVYARFVDRIDKDYNYYVRAVSDFNK